MVLASRGQIHTESELRSLCDCTELGTDAFNLVEAARSLGFPGTRKYNLTFAELGTELRRGIYPIVYLRTQVLQEHAVVVMEITEDQVRMLDPTRGEHACSHADFLRDWELMRRLTILVE